MQNNKERLRSITAEEYAKFRVEETRRDLMRMLAAVELGTEIGLRLQGILEKAVIEVEDLSEDAEDYEED